VRFAQDDGIRGGSVAAWDPGKAASNLRKHGVAFEEAITGFDDPFAQIAPDVKHSLGRETRQWLIGETDSGRIAVVVFTDRSPGPVRRLISARSASRKERTLYEFYKRVPL